MKKLCFIFIIFNILGCVSVEKNNYEGLLYKEDKDAIIIIGYTGNKDDVHIPNIINNKPVKYISDRAFMDNTIIRNIFIPSSVESIGVFAFSGCDNLKYVYLLDSTDKNRFSVFHETAFNYTKQENIIVSLPATKTIETIYNKNCILQWATVIETITNNGRFNYRYGSSNYSASESNYIVYNDQIISVPYAHKNEIKIEEIKNDILFYYKAPRERIYTNHKDYLVYYNGIFLLSDYNVNIIQNNNVDIYFSVGSSRNNFLFKNNQLIISGNIENIKISRDGDIYYTKEQNRLVSIFKNDQALLQNIEGFSNFDVDDTGENIVYTILENITFKLYKNNQLITTSNNFIFYPSISPNGNKIYYFEAR